MVPFKPKEQAMSEQEDERGRKAIYTVIAWLQKHKLHAAEQEVRGLLPHQGDDEDANAMPYDLDQLIALHPIALQSAADISARLRTHEHSLAHPSSGQHPKRGRHRYKRSRGRSIATCEHNSRSDAQTLLALHESGGPQPQRKHQPPLESDRSDVHMAKAMRHAVPSSGTSGVNSTPAAASSAAGGHVSTTERCVDQRGVTWVTEELSDSDSHGV